MIATVARMIWLSWSIAARTLPELGTKATLAIRLVALPIFLSAFYLAIASAGFNQNTTFGDAVAAACAVAGVAATVATATLVSLDRFEATTAYWTLSERRAAMAAWCGRYALLITLGLITGVSGLVGSVLFQILPAPNLQQAASSAAVLATASVTAIGLGLFVGTVSSRMRDSLLLANIIEQGLPIIVGAVVPITVFPPVVYALASIIPIGRATQAARLVTESAPAATEIVAAFVTSAMWATAAIAINSIYSRRDRQGQATAMQ